MKFAKRFAISKQYLGVDESQCYTGARRAFSENQADFCIIVVFVDRSSVARWESGNRVPDLILLRRLAECLDVELSVLIKGVDLKKQVPVIIMVDDEKSILNGNLRVLGEMLPDAEITGFTRPSEAIHFADSSCPCCPNR